MALTSHVAGEALHSLISIDRSTMSTSMKNKKYMKWPQDYIMKNKWCLSFCATTTVKNWQAKIHTHPRTRQKRKAIDRNSLFTYLFIYLFIYLSIYLFIYTPKSVHSASPLRIPLFILFINKKNSNFKTTFRWGWSWYWKKKRSVFNNLCKFSRRQWILCYK